MTALQPRLHVAVWLMWRSPGLPGVVLAGDIDGGAARDVGKLPGTLLLLPQCGIAPL